MIIERARLEACSEFFSLGADFILRGAEIFSTGAESRPKCAKNLFASPP